MTRLGRPHGELEALAAHVLHEDGDVQRAAPAHDELVGRLARLHAQRQIALQLAVQALLARCAARLLLLLLSLVKRGRFACHKQ